MSYTVVRVSDANKKERTARKILSALPDWFGIPESTEEYIRNSTKMPFWACFDASGKACGFIALRETSPAAAEIYVMGVLQPCHRRGIGTALWAAFRQYAAQNGYRLIQVKTVQEGCYEQYDATNAFYRSLGFLPLEVFPNLWDPHNPCQIYVYPII